MTLHISAWPRFQKTQDYVNPGLWTLWGKEGEGKVLGEYRQGKGGS